MVMRKKKRIKEFAGIVGEALLEFAKTGNRAKLKRKVNIARINFRR